MKYVINVPGFDTVYSFPLSASDPFQRIEVENVCIIDIFKWHSHRYDLKAFFYNSKLIVGCCSFSTKKELYGAIQNLLQQHL